MNKSYRYYFLFYHMLQFYQNIYLSILLIKNLYSSDSGFYFKFKKFLEIDTINKFIISVVEFLDIMIDSDVWKEKKIY